MCEALTPSPPICDGATAIGIDIPLTTPMEGRRSAESLARGLLPGRSSSVFSTPPADVLAEATYQAALHRARQVYGYGISAQAYALRRAIVDARDSQLALHEVHPELSFSVMNSGHHLASKKSWTGMRQRLDLLTGHGITIPADVGTAGGSPPTTSWTPARPPGVPTGSVAAQLRRSETNPVDTSGFSTLLT